LLVSFLLLYIIHNNRVTTSQDAITTVLGALQLHHAACVPSPTCRTARRSTALLEVQLHRATCIFVQLPPGPRPQARHSPFPTRLATKTGQPQAQERGKQGCHELNPSSMAMPPHLPRLPIWRGREVEEEEGVIGSPRKKKRGMAGSTKQKPDYGRTTQFNLIPSALVSHLTLSMQEIKLNPVVCRVHPTRELK
jgi:hypothetical protein